MQSTEVLQSVLPRAVCVALVIVGLLAACDASFDPYEAKSEQYFSVYGVIDASAERQTIRVERLGDFERGDPIHGTVKSTHLASGRTTTWRDTTLRLIGQDRERRLQNYWTDVNFRPGETYRLEVEGEKGRGETSVEVTLPEDVPDIELSRTPQCIPVPGYDYPPITVRVTGVSRVADITAAYDTSKTTSSSSADVDPFEVRHLSDTTRVDENTVSASIDWHEVTETCRGLESFSITVSVAGPDWPTEYGHDIIRLGQRGDNGRSDVSNVHNGFGFVGGVVSTTVEVPITKVEQ